MITFSQPYISDELTIDHNCTGAGRRTVWARRPGTVHATLIDRALSQR
jgi:hypothetical protein